MAKDKESFASISLAGWVGVILLLFLGFFVSFIGFQSGGFVEVGILICAILAIKNGNRLLGIAEILAAIYLRFTFGSCHYLY